MSDINLTNIEEKINNLITKIRHYNYMYYVKNISEISDFDFDKLLQELSDLEQQYPQLAKPDSPTNRIGYLEESSGKLIKRTIPMLSLRHTYEFEEFQEICLKFLEFGEIVIEPKIDGVAINIIYKNGFLESMSLRGDGITGEDVTGQVYFLENICTKIKDFNGEIRGEVIIENHHEIKNKRNFASGALRHKNPTHQNLKFIPYRVIANDDNYCFKTQSEGLEFLSKYFEISPFVVLNSQDTFKEIVDNFINIKFPYETDGIVVKINKIEIFNNLGSSNRYPKGAIALKFQSNSHKSKIINIEWEINRRGRYVPVGIIEQIMIDHSKINKIYIHNARFIKTNQIGIGSEVEITKIGNIIPKITKILTNQEYNFPTECFFCKQNLILGEIDLYCPNINCSGIFLQKAAYFLKTLGLNNLSKDTLEKIIIGGNINNYKDLIVTMFNSKWISNVNDKKAFIYFNNLKGHLKLSTLLVAFGIDGVGPEIINYIENLSLKDISIIDSNIKKTQNLINYIKNNGEMIKDICELLKVKY